MLMGFFSLLFFKRGFFKKEKSLLFSTELLFKTKL